MVRGSNPVTMAQDLSQMGQQAKEKIGGAVGQFMDGNQSRIKQVINQESIRWSLGATRSS